MSEVFEGAHRKVTLEQCKSHFTILEELCRLHGAEFNRVTRERRWAGRRVVTMDETPLPYGQKDEPCVVLKGAEHAFRLEGASHRTNVTLVPSIMANGEVLPLCALLRPALSVACVPPSHGPYMPTTHVAHAH